jgi:hypothetical protein
MRPRRKARAKRGREGREAIQSRGATTRGEEATELASSSSHGELRAFCIVVVVVVVVVVIVVLTDQIRISTYYLTVYFYLFRLTVFLTLVLPVQIVFSTYFLPLRSLFLP